MFRGRSRLPARLRAYSAITRCQKPSLVCRDLAVSAQSVSHVHREASRVHCILSLGLAIISGLEIIGITALVFQIADLGGKYSEHGRKQGKPESIRHGRLRKSVFKPRQVPQRTKKKKATIQLRSMSLRLPAFHCRILCLGTGKFPYTSG